MKLAAALLGTLLLVACSDASVGDAGGDGAGAGPGEGGSGASGPATSTGTTGSAATVGAGGGALRLGPEHCDEPSPGVTVGFDVGQQLGDVVVKDCDGNDISLEAFCGAQALWVFAAHGWCPLCQSVSGKQESILADYAAQGLVAINVVVQDGQSQPPDPAYCALWRETHGHVGVYTLYDPTESILALWPGGSSSLSAFVDADRVIRSKLVHESNEATIRSEIEAALAPP